MTRYTIDQREWVPTPYGFDVWVIPGREVAAVVELPEMPLIVRANPSGTTIRYLVAYLTEHDGATARQMQSPEQHISESTICSCLAAHPKLFVSRMRTAQGAKIWRLRGQP